MVPTVRPSANTSILAPTRWGVDPVVDTIVTSAAGSPRSSASETAAKTSRFISDDYMRDTSCPPSGGPDLIAPSDNELFTGLPADRRASRNDRPMQLAALRRLGP